MISHDAVRAVYPNAVQVKGSTPERLKAFDENGSEIALDISAIQEVNAGFVTNENLQSLRRVRDRKLAETDWVVVKAQDTNTDVPIAWQEYRQALRDITDTYSSIEDVVWPTKPE